MSWLEAKLTVHKSKAKRPSFTANVGHRSGCRITIPDDVLQELKWGAGATLRALCGAGEHMGWMRIEPDTAGAAHLAIMGKSKVGVVYLGTFPQLSSEPIEKSECAHRVIGKAFELQVPKGSLVAPRAVAVA